jgi:hypothetical protein
MSDCDGKELTVRVIEYERTEYIKRGIEIVTKATSDLNHFNNQTNGTSPALSDHPPHAPGQVGESLTNDPEASGYEGKKWVYFAGGIQNFGSLVHF